MIHRILALGFAVLCSPMAFSQCNDFFHFKEGVRLEYDHIDKKEKVAARTAQSFKDISGSGANMKAKLHQEIIDVKKNEVIGSSESEWTCENGTLQFSVNSMNMGMSGQAYNPSVSVEVTGDKTDLPSNLKVGQTLSDVHYQVKSTMSGITLINQTFDVTDRKVEAQEEITTPAGKFNCYKLTFKTNSKGKMGGSNTMRTVAWYAKNTGLIKMEMFDESGKFLGRQLLTKVVN